MKKICIITAIAGTACATASVIKKVSDVKKDAFKSGYKSGLSDSMLFAEKTMSDFSDEMKKLTEPVIEENLELREKYMKLISDYESLIEEYNTLASDYCSEDDEDIEE